MINNICIGKHMSVIQKMLRVYLNSKLSDYDINHSQFFFILYLFDHENISQRELNNFMRYDKGSIARIAESLEDLGYIARESNPDDHRAYKIHLTNKARDIYPKMIDMLNEWNSFLTEGENNTDINLMKNILDRMAQKSINKVRELKHGKK